MHHSTCVAAKLSLLAIYNKATFLAVYIKVKCITQYIKNILVRLVEIRITVDKIPFRENNRV